MARRGTPLPQRLRDTIKLLLRGGRCEHCIDGMLDRQQCSKCGGRGFRDPMSMRGVARELKIDHHTVKKYATQVSPNELNKRHPSPYSGD